MRDTQFHQRPRYSSDDIDRAVRRGHQLRSRAFHDLLRGISGRR